MSTSWPLEARFEFSDTTGYVGHYNRQRPHRGIDLGVPTRTGTIEIPPRRSTSFVTTCSVASSTSTTRWPRSQRGVMGTAGLIPSAGSRRDYRGTPPFKQPLPPTHDGKTDGPVGESAVKSCC
jgi:hypothetical protein